MKIKTSELTGKALDWAVAQAEGLKSLIHYPKAVAVLSPGIPRFVPFMPSTDWQHGGPIIERENITIIRADNDYPSHIVDYIGPGVPSWFAECSRFIGHNVETSYEHQQMEPAFLIEEISGYYGPTPLTAAMRAYVTLKLGEEVEIPDELLQ